MDESVDLKPALLRLYPQIVEVAKAYAEAYPPDSTAAEIVNAVTVAVPLRTFMVLAALAGQVLASAE
jgi:hypothetical protein